MDTLIDTILEHDSVEELMGGGNCGHGNDCRHCEHLHPTCVGCKLDGDSDFWMNQRIKELRSWVSTFGKLAVLRWLLNNLDANDALMLWDAL